MSGQRSDTAEPVILADEIKNVAAILGGRELPPPEKGNQQ